MRFCSEIVLGTVVVASCASLAMHAENIPPSPDNAAISAGRVVSVVRMDARSGRLVRTVLVQPPSSQSQASANPRVRAMVEETAKNLDVSPLLVDSVIQVESNYNPYAISPKGAQGLMQLMPDTARRFGVKNTFDPQQNIEGGVRYLKFLQDTFGDDQLAIAAYNAGEKAVAKYGSVPPYRETVGYVAKVGQKYSQAKRVAADKEASAQKFAAPPPADETHHVIGYVDQEGRLHITTR